MEKKIVTSQKLESLFLEILAYADLKNITKAVNLFRREETDEFVQTDVLHSLRCMYEELCRMIAEQEVDEDDLPVGVYRHGMCLQYTGGEPAMELTLQLCEAYN